MQLDSIRLSPLQAFNNKFASAIASSNFGKGDDFLVIRLYSGANLVSSITTSDYTIESGYAIIDLGNLLDTDSVFSGLFQMEIQGYRWVYNAPLIATETSPNEVRLVVQDTSVPANINTFLAFSNYDQGDTYYHQFHLLEDSTEYKTLPIVGKYVDAITEPDFPYSLICRCASSPNPDVEIYRIVEQIIDPVVLDLKVVPEEVQNTTLLKAFRPDFFAKGSNTTGPNTDYYNWDELVNSPDELDNQTLLNSTVSKSFSQENLQVDYSSWHNFIKFSSARKRLEVFWDKLEDVEYFSSKSFYASGAYQQGAFNASSGVTSSTIGISDYQYWEAKRADVIANFDGYEKYLYFESGSKQFPKTTSIKPFTNTSISSSAASTWKTTWYDSASSFDLQNDTNLLKTIPFHIVEDSASTEYLTFVNMTGHYFDQIYEYIDGLHRVTKRTEKYAVPPKLLWDVAKGYAWTLASGFDSDTLQSFYLGKEAGEYRNTGQVALDAAEMAKQGYTPSVPGESLRNEVWQRVVNTLPYIYETKGTQRSIRAFTNTYGIPSTILRVNEYSNTTDWNFTSSLHAQEIGDWCISGGLTNIYVKEDYSSRDEFKTMEVVWQMDPTLDADLYMWMSGPLAIQLHGTSASYATASLLSLTAPDYTTPDSVVLPFHNGKPWHFSWRVDHDTEVANVSVIQIDEDDGDVKYFESFDVTGSLVTDWLAGTSGPGGAAGTSSRLYVGNSFNNKLYDYKEWTEYLDNSVLIEHARNPKSLRGATLSSSIHALRKHFDFSPYTFGDFSLAGSKAVYTSSHINIEKFGPREDAGHGTILAASTTDKVTRTHWVKLPVGGGESLDSNKIRCISSSVLLFGTEDSTAVTVIPADTWTPTNLTSSTLFERWAVNDATVASVGSAPATVSNWVGSVKGYDLRPIRRDTEYYEATGEISQSNGQILGTDMSASHTGSHGSMFAVMSPERPASDASFGRYIGSDYDANDTGLPYALWLLKSAQSNTLGFAGSGQALLNGDNKYITKNIAIVHTQFHSDGRALYYNGVEDLSDAVVMSASFMSMSLGGTTFGNATAGARYKDVMLIEGEISDGEREYIEGYYAHLYDLTDDLPANHPFKSTAPLSGEETLVETVTPGQPAEAVTFWPDRTALTASDFPAGSDRVSVGFNPAYYQNIHLANLFGELDLSQYVNPNDIYSSSYSELGTLKELYTETLGYKINLNGFLRTLKAFDVSLFEQIKKLLPARAVCDVGYTIEPMFFERPKFWSYNRPSSSYHVMSASIPTTSTEYFSSSWEGFHDVTHSVFGDDGYDQRYSGSRYIWENYVWSLQTGSSTTVTLDSPATSFSAFLQSNATNLVVNGVPYGINALNSNSVTLTQPIALVSESSWYLQYGDVAQSSASGINFGAVTTSNQGVSGSLEGELVDGTVGFFFVGYDQGNSTIPQWDEITFLSGNGGETPLLDLDGDPTASLRLYGVDTASSNAKVLNGTLDPSADWPNRIQFILTAISGTEEINPSPVAVKSTYPPFPKAASAGTFSFGGTDYDIVKRISNYQLQIDTDLTSNEFGSAGLTYTVTDQGYTDGTISAGELETQSVAIQNVRWREALMPFISASHPYRDLSEMKVFESGGVIYSRSVEPARVSNDYHFQGRQNRLYGGSSVYSSLVTVASGVSSPLVIWRDANTGEGFYYASSSNTYDNGPCIAIYEYEDVNDILITGN